ncbi:MAG: hypothetical protein BGO69_19955 [Bacteroidetes bacterium 46-16]|nr:MAG: hypothetical protein BGO69_19955 [Bacteroidetes bacterium 46-16]
MPENYSFTTHWYVNAPLKDVWELIYKSEEWPKWWNGVLSVTETEKGDERGIGSIRIYRLRSPMLYTLSFRLLLTQREEYKHLAGNASGELEGEGAWHFDTGEGVTHVRCHWNVHTNIKWMNTFAFLLKPVFMFNHRLVMKQGAKCLAKKLGTTVITN